MNTSQVEIANVEEYFAQHERKEILRVFTCGSVDDGKSTLIGRLLFDSHLIYEDQLSAVTAESARRGNVDGGFDPSLFTDGLKAEREQGITIDVAYRYFSTASRKFIVADTPGHEQYTRNMATGASNCELAIILVDARNGVTVQTRRHSFIVSLLGIRHVLVAVNKMDQVDYSQARFNEIVNDFTGFAARLELRDINFIPISALDGDNVVNSSENMPWHRGGTLMHYLEHVVIATDRNLIDFRLPVQYVSRPEGGNRGYCGSVASGVVRRGDEIMVLPSRRRSRVKSIVTYDGGLEEAFAPNAVTIVLDDQVDIARGDVLVHPGNLPRMSETLDAMIVWMDEKPLVPGKRYELKHMSKKVGGAVSSIRYRIDVDTFHRQKASELALNEIGRCTLSLNEAIAFDPYRANRATGAFILVDRLSNATVGAGMVIDRSRVQEWTEHWETAPSSPALRSETSHVSSEERAARFGQRPATILLTGRSGAGKTTIAYALERRLFDMGHAANVLDGQNLRLGISRDLGFTATERSEALRRAAEMARVINEAGLICVCAFVSPSEDIRLRMRGLIGDQRMLLVHLSAPLEVCRERDEDGLYALADSGEITDFPGVTAPYEAPASADLVLPTHEISAEESVDRLIAFLKTRGVLG